MTPVLVALLFLPCDSWKTTEPALNTTIVKVCPHTAVVSWRDDGDGSMEYSRWKNAQSFSVGDPVPVLVAEKSSPKLKYDYKTKKKAKSKKRKKRR